MQPIGFIKTDFKDKFGIPRQSGIINELKGTVIFEPEYRNPDAVRGIEDFSHIWLIWFFSELQYNEFKPTVRPPRLGGNKRIGVFATRSPYRPNRIGMSLVKLDGIKKTRHNGTVLQVSGADMLDETPILDIKPYLPFSEAVPDAIGGFTEYTSKYKLRVNFPDDLLNRIPIIYREAIIQILENDPRPSYHTDNRHYHTVYAGYEIEFSADIEKQQISVLSVNI